MKTKRVTLNVTSLRPKQLASIAMALRISPNELRRDGIPKVENKKQETILRMKLEGLL